MSHEDRASDEEQRLKKKRLKQVESEEEEEEEEDDDEDEDEEEEEEDEDEYDRRRKKKSKRKGILADEASEGSDEDDEDEGGELGEVKEVLSESQLKQLEKRREEERRFRGMSAEEVARQLEERYKMNEAMNRVSATTFTGAATIDTVRLVRERPRTDDPKLFMVRCKPGEERALVVKLYANYVKNKFKKPEPEDPNARRSRWNLPPPPGAELEVFTILAPGTSGYIYVESMKEECVKAAIRGVAGVFSSSISIVPLEEMQDVLRIEMRKDVIRQGDYVRLRGPYPYKGDLAQVIATQDGGNKLTVRVVPRIDINLLKVNFTMKDRQGAAPPPAKPFNADEIRAAGGSVGRDSTDEYDTFDEHRFQDGLLLLDLNQRQVQAVSERPNLEEVAPFAASKGDAGAETKDEASALAEEMRKTMSKQKKVQYFDFAIGDRVLVSSGAERGAEGVVDSLDIPHGLAGLRLPQGERIDIQLKDLVKKFLVGDHVKVLHGKHAGKTGNVVQIVSGSADKPSVLIYTDFGNEEIQVMNSELKVSSEIAAGMDSLNGYKLYDLVMLDQGVHGIIVRVNAETVRILTQNNEIREVPTTVIRAKKNSDSKFSSTPDVNNHMLNVGDQVIVNQGPYRNSEGVIKHIFRGQLFMYCKPRELENAGIIIVKGRDVRIAGSFQPLPAQAAGPPRAAMRGGGPRGGGPSGRGGRHHDETIGKTVRIRKGTDKGLVGTVVEGGSAHLLRVELNARNRVINVPRENVEFEEVRAVVPEYAPASMPEESGRMPHSSAAYPTPMYEPPADGGRSSGRGQQSGASAAVAQAPQFKPHDSVRLIDTGEEVMVYQVIDRDVVVLGSNGQMKLVPASNLRY